MFSCVCDPRRVPRTPTHDAAYASTQVHQEDSLTKESMQTNPEARYWADRYTVQAEQVPMFLSSLEDDILTTGKYLNVLRGGSTRVESPVAITIPFAEGRQLRSNACRGRCLCYHGPACTQTRATTAAWCIRRGSLPARSCWTTS